MKIVLIIIPILFLAGLIALFVLGQMSQSGKANGIIDGKLSKCPDKPNCICTEFEADLTHYVEPIAYSPRTPSEVLTRLKNSIAEMGGNIRTERNNYLAATFTSSFFRFADDLEIRVDTDRQMIHFRSASRVGYSDRGVNKKRVERLKNLFAKKIE